MYMISFEGDPLTFTNWVPGHTDNFVNHTQEDCVALIPYKGGVWDDIPCGSRDPFFGGDSGETQLPLCEYSMLTVCYNVLRNFHVTCKTI